MKKYILTIAAFVIALFPNFVFAQELEIENEDSNFAETTKYYKTVTIYDDLKLNAYSSNTVNNTNSYTVEVSKDEYDNATETIVTRSGSASVETTYKKLTTTITPNGSKYQHKVVLNWKTMPSVRSYDIIGIGFPNSVKVDSVIFFQQYYCTTSGSCATTTTYIPKTGTYGGSAVIPLVSGNLSVMRETLYFNIAKNTSSTITTLHASGDYAHATSNISSSTAENYSMSVGGINLNSSISGYYDSM